MLQNGKVAFFTAKRQWSAEFGRSPAHKRQTCLEGGLLFSI